MTVQPLEKAVPATAEIVPLTVDQYHRMIEAGILASGERIELLDGLLVHKDRGPGMTVNPIHAAVLDLPARKVEVYEEPDASSGRYLRRTELQGDDPVPFLLPDGGRHEARVRAILSA